MLELLQHFWHFIISGLALAAALTATAHAVLYKRDSRAAVAWLGFIWLLPGLGPLLYLLLGVNRIKRRAASVRRDSLRRPALRSPFSCSLHDLARQLPEEVGHFRLLATATRKINGEHLLSGNRVTPLQNGEAAYPEMLRAMERAERSIALSTYLFDADRTGRDFIQALEDAKARGVEVRVIVDDVGDRYSRPYVIPILQEKGILAAGFMSVLQPRRIFFSNLRNHRKILIADGKTGFSGGMNLSENHLVHSAAAKPVQDLHFKLEGPAVRHLQEAFTEDWFFCTGEALDGSAWFPELKQEGRVLARGIIDGPDGDFEKLRWTLLAALSCVQHSVQIVTPYFLPDRELIAALSMAAIRGVRVDIVLPSVSNLPFVQWACNAMLWQVLEHGCRVWLSPPPFDHTKLMLVDRYWSLFGSANWDPRTLRLNFEFNVECYERELAAALEAIVQQKINSSHRVTMGELACRPLPIKLRDGCARLLTPYL